MDIAKFDARYPTPGHAAAAERRERLPACDRARFDYLRGCRERAIRALKIAENDDDRSYNRESIEMVDRGIAKLERRWR
ncbi:hypothetical protein IFR23_13020 [Sphingomonas sp. CFBP 13603]|uniref:hypothetical protein n=1 Tax=Sphingomonas sp. CFBP 13603 TaxID=2774040 RepID=UPI001868E751|nr:hypothetical protein [Sphingomonas sp. CFBP 13603]MBE2992933.1 hypothetical protein [Sphingomonas sp. CFBP 13603]